MRGFIESVKRLLGRSTEQLATQRKFKQTLTDIDERNRQLSSILKDIEKINTRATENLRNSEPPLLAKKEAVS